MLDEEKGLFEIARKKKKSFTFTHKKKHTPQGDPPEKVFQLHT